MLHDFSLILLTIINIIFYKYKCIIKYKSILDALRGFREKGVYYWFMYPGLHRDDNVMDSGPPPTA